MVLFSMVDNMDYQPTKKKKNRNFLILDGHIRQIPTKEQFHHTSGFWEAIF
jgi:hypothetical protein